MLGRPTTQWAAVRINLSGVCLRDFDSDDDDVCGIKRQWFSKYQSKVCLQDTNKIGNLSPMRVPPQLNFGWTWIVSLLFTPRFPGVGGLKSRFEPPTMKGASLGPNSLTCVSQVDQPRVLAQLSILTSHDSIEDKVPAARSRAAVELLLNLNPFQILTLQCSYNQGGFRTMAPEELGNFSG